MKILIVILGRIGDMILSTPMFSAIKNKYPSCRITVLASIPNHVVIRDNPFVDDIFVYDKSPVALAKLFFKIRKIEYDSLIDPKDHFSNEGNLIAGLIKAQKKIGIISGSQSNFNIGIDDNISNNGLHFTTRVMNSLKHLDFIPTNVIPKPELFLNPESEIRIKEFLGNLGERKIIIFNISSGSRSRIWSKENWIKLIKSIIDDDFCPVLIYISADKHTADEIISETGIMEFSSDNFRDIISLLDKASLIVTPDTSFVHVASAFNKPILALYSGLDYNLEKFSPLSDIREVIKSEPGDESLNSIPYQIPIEKLKILLEKIKNP